MRLRDGEIAVVDIAKLRLYCLDPTHPRGAAKAKHFAARLGLCPGDAESLQDQLLKATRRGEAVAVGERDEFGQRYHIDADIAGPNGSATVRSTWIARADGSPPRLLTCYVL